jgi:hypothetical protein
VQVLVCLQGDNTGLKKKARGVANITERHAIHV